MPSVKNSVAKPLTEHKAWVIGGVEDDGTVTMIAICDFCGWKTDRMSADGDTNVLQQAADHHMKTANAAMAS